MLEQYDAMQGIDPGAWTQLTESERLRLVIEYHEREGIQVPNVSLHATLHCVVENQVALGDETPVQRTIERLTASGLSRHDAVHAVASILGRYFYRAWKSHQKADESQYFAEVENLEPSRWLRTQS